MIALPKDEMLSRCNPKRIGLSCTGNIWQLAVSFSSLKLWVINKALASSTLKYCPLPTAYCQLFSGTNYAQSESKFTEQRAPKRPAWHRQMGGKDVCESSRIEFPQG
jgi:hypothetical protein